jgi:hypothetical protein
MNKLDELKAQAAETQHRIDIIESHARGEPIQCRLKDGNGNWVDLAYTESPWNFGELEFRKKPEPAVCYRNQYSIGWTRNAYASEREARKHASPQAIRVGVKFVEVPE